MGEAVLSGGEGMELDKKDGAEEVVRWERLRVLLVEADYSTRQIIAALLRKCSYRVAAVADGLKAWETLKGRPHSIDLVLTEVELPSISGFALLSLVMEHDVCKNIPVIMMSSHDSIGMVLKCMLKGAADFLIKPVRKNELRNLWQHVWRRHTLAGRHVPQNIAVPQQKVEGTSENNASSSHSSECVASTHRKNECSEKGSDAQSSCTTPYMEAESADMQNMQGLSQMKCGSASNLSNTDMEKHGECTKLDQESVLPESENGEKSKRLGSEISPYREANNSTLLRLEEDHTLAETMSQNEGVQAETNRGYANAASEIHNCDDELVEPSNGAIDLIGTFDNHPRCTDGNSSYKDGGTKKFEFVPHLELSLRRTCPSSSNYQGTDERHTLIHSNASAFSWYNSCKTLQPLLPTLSGNCSKLKEGASKSYELSSNQLSGSTNGTFLQASATLSNSQENMPTLVIGQSGQVELQFPSHQLGTVPVPGNSPFFPSMLFTQSGLPPVSSPKPTCERHHSPFPSSASVQSNPEIPNSELGYHQSDETTNNSIHQAVHEENDLEHVEEIKDGFPAAGQNTTSSLCYGAVDHTDAYGSSSTRRDETATATAPESWNESGLSVHDVSRGMDSLRATQREAALTKFRLKRKDRCFEKKVRYQSRKRLAEQRPRVKGQFVRQV
ncbi:hypothetical protein FH972_003732 [Carpinus fangiana]|uniref:Response regulatory domain-containing protein n=1 Tax=Carpinus fangiana TaxID=176857 RepID=A0A5N6QLN4_9ROSI|nr:hypothetical protein FH972_003732 [Carpinus fangiana]